MLERYGGRPGGREDDAVQMERYVKDGGDPGRPEEGVAVVAYVVHGR